MWEMVITVHWVPAKHAILIIGRANNTAVETYVAIDG